MTLPDSIKEEIEKATCYVNNDLSYSLVYDIRIIMKEIATQFYLKALADRDAIAKAAFEAGRKHIKRSYTNSTQSFESIQFECFRVDDYLASDEYKKLVGDI